MSGLLKELWSGISIEGYHKIKPLTGNLDAIPSKFKNLNFYSFENWFESMALRAQNDCNIYLDFIFNKWEFETFPAEIKETVIDMIYILIEHWVFNRVPIEFFVDATNNLNTSNMSYIASNLANNMQDMLPQRVKALANFTELKEFLIPYNDVNMIDGNMIDLGLYYSKYTVDVLLKKEKDERIIKDQDLEINKLDAKKQLYLTGEGYLQRITAIGALGVKYNSKDESVILNVDVTKIGEGIVIDNLNTDSGKDALSALQGKILNNKIINKLKKIEINELLTNWDGRFDLTKIGFNRHNLYKIMTTLIAFYGDGTLNNPIIEGNFTGNISYQNCNYIFENKKLYKFNNEQLELVNSNLSYEMYTNRRKWIFEQNKNTYLIQEVNIFQFNGSNLILIARTKYWINGVAIFNNQVYINWGDNSVSIFENSELKLTEIKSPQFNNEYMRLSSGFVINNVKYFIFQKGEYEYVPHKLFKLLSDNKSLEEISTFNNKISYFKFQNQDFIINKNIYRFENEKFNLFQLGDFSSFDYSFQFNNQTHFGSNHGIFYFYNSVTKEFNKTKTNVSGDYSIDINVFENNSKLYIFSKKGIFLYQDFLKIFLNKVITSDFLNMYDDQQYLRIYNIDDEIHEFLISIKNMILSVKYLNNKKFLSEILIKKVYQIWGDE